MSKRKRRGIGYAGQLTAPKLKPSRRIYPPADPSTVPTLRLEYISRADGDKPTTVAMRWKGPASAGTLAAWVDAYNRAIAPGGSAARVSKELGYTPTIRAAVITHGRETLARWSGHNILTFGQVTR